MRVTNTMLTNSATSHIFNAKSSLLKYEEQYTTQKKIQRPSDDPTIAVRSLKLRNTYAQLTQYAEKNIQDAMDWMDTTESALSNIGSNLTNMKGFLNQGANDYLEAEDRTSILATLQQYADSIFEDEANSDYAGRYLFTGHRTDTSLLFGAITTNTAYQITEHFSNSDIDSVTVVTGGPDIAVDVNTVDSGQVYVEQAATTNTVYKMRLAYDNCTNTEFPGTSVKAKTGAVTVTLEYKDDAGDIQEEALAVTRTMTSKELNADGTDAYNIKEDEVVYLYDTGEILMGKNVYADIKAKDAAITIDYRKDEFAANDIRPEMYFECISYNTISEKTIEYAEPANQEIKYEVNYSQTLIVNTQAKDAISTDIRRVIDYIAQAIELVDEVETKIATVQKQIENTTDESTIAKLESLKSTLEQEKELRVTVMTEAFGKGLTMVDRTQQVLGEAVAELGAKYNRAELTYNKLLDQQTDTEEKMSSNEDVDLADVYINLAQADNLYQASLSATVKILGNSLLDYI